MSKKKLVAYFCEKAEDGALIIDSRARVNQNMVYDCTIHTVFTEEGSDEIKTEKFLWSLPENKEGTKIFTAFLKKHYGDDADKAIFMNNSSMVARDIQNDARLTLQAKG